MELRTLLFSTVSLTPEYEAMQAICKRPLLAPPACLTANCDVSHLPLSGSTNSQQVMVRWQTIESNATSKPEVNLTSSRLSHRSSLTPSGLRRNASLTAVPLRNGSQAFQLVSSASQLTCLHFINCVTLLILTIAVFTPVLQYFNRVSILVNR